MWKLARNALPIAANLKAQGLNINSTCLHCWNIETAANLFWNALLHVKFGNLPQLGIPCSPLLPPQSANLWLKRRLLSVCLQQVSLHTSFLGHVGPYGMRETCLCSKVEMSQLAV